jgi:hypothetical protein
MPGLQRLPKLRRLNVLATPVSAAAVKRIMGARPGLAVIHPSVLSG